MPVLEEIAAKLEGLGLGTLTGASRNLFIGDMPATPHACGSVNPSGGLAPENGFGAPGIQYETPDVQIVFRDAAGEFAAAFAKAQTAYVELAKVEAQVLSGGPGETSAFYHHIHPQQPPFLLRRDGSDRPYVALHVLCEKEPSA